MKKIITPLLAILLISCGGSTSTGNPEIGGIYDEEDYKLVYQYNASVRNGSITRWPTKFISIWGISLENEAIKFWEKYGFTFLGLPGEIEYIGETSEDSSYCGRAYWTWKNDIQGNSYFKSCNIALNVRKHTGYQCSTVTSTLIHEIGHCLGVLVHTNDGSVMDSRTNGSTTISDSTARMLEVLYATRTDAKVSQDGKVTYEANSLERKSGFGAME